MNIKSFTTAGAAFFAFGLGMVGCAQADVGTPESESAEWKAAPAGESATSLTAGTDLTWNSNGIAWKTHIDSVKFRSGEACIRWTHQNAEQYSEGFDVPFEAFSVTTPDKLKVDAPSGMGGTPWCDSLPTDGSGATEGLKYSFTTHVTLPASGTLTLTNEAGVTVASVATK